MGESTLSPDFDFIVYRITRMLGMSETSYDDLETDEQADVDRIIKDGLRTAYYPPPVEQGEPSHEWSFLRPTRTLPIESGQWEYDLPDDFSGEIIGNMSYAAGVQKPKVAQVNVEQLLDMRAEDDQSGDPTYFAVRVKPHVANRGTRWEALFYPTPNASRSLSYRYPIQPHTIDSDEKYPIGGTVHGSMIVAAILAAAERYMDDEEAVHMNHFMAELRKSIRIDRQQGQVSTVSPWVQSNDADTLETNFHYAQRLIGQYMQFGWNVAIWNHEQRNVVDMLIEQGLQQFYYPPPLPGQKIAHTWSFLNPFLEMAVYSGNRWYHLPPDFDHFIDRVTFQEEDNDYYHPLHETSPQRLDSLGTQENYQSYPRWYATRPIQSDGRNPQRQQIGLHPTPDAAYLIRGRYMALQRKLSAENPYPLGGQRHGQTFLYACLSAAEMVRDGGPGPMHGKFFERLASSIAADYNRGPGVLGYNGNQATMLRHSRRLLRDDLYYNDVTYNGTSYSGN